MAKNILICGSGRSGTSMLAGIFSETIYQQGDDLYPPREANPKGFFENWRINSLNENIIYSSLKSQYGNELLGYFKLLYKPGQLWLANIPVNLRSQITDDFSAEIRELTSRKPFCFKDPRFCFTLDGWLDNLENVHALCIFRDPGIVVASILKEIQNASYLNDLSICVNDLYKNWQLMYTRVLDLKLKGYSIYFINYDDLFVRQKIEELEDFSGTKLNSSFPDLKLNRTYSDVELNKKTLDLYNFLKYFSEFDFEEQTTVNLSDMINHNVDILEAIKQCNNDHYSLNTESGADDYLKVLTKGDISGLVKILNTNYQKSVLSLKENSKNMQALIDDNSSLQIEIKNAKDDAESRIVDLKNQNTINKNKIIEILSQIESFKTEKALLEEMISNMRFKADRDQALIRNLTTDLESRDERINSFGMENSQYKGMIKELQQESRNNVALIKTLDDRISNLVFEIEALKNTYSWRVTKPFRSIYFLFKKLLKH